jgi:hypothetical protein
MEFTYEIPFLKIGPCLPIFVGDAALPDSEGKPVVRLQSRTIFKSRGENG